MYQVVFLFRLDEFLFCQDVFLKRQGVLIKTPWRLSWNALAFYLGLVLTCVHLYTFGTPFWITSRWSADCWFCEVNLNSRSVSFFIIVCSEESVCIGIACTKERHFNHFIINYSILTPLKTFTYTYYDFYFKLQSQKRPNIFTKNFTIYIITKIKPNKKHLPTTPNPIFKFKYQRLISQNTKNNNLIYLKKENKISFFDSKKQLHIYNINNIKLK